MSSWLSGSSRTAGGGCHFTPATLTHAPGELVDSCVEPAHELADRAELGEQLVLGDADLGLDLAFRTLDLRLDESLRDGADDEGEEPGADDHDDDRDHSPRV